ncbi:hypothetical protein NQ314_010791 [Rhamnusium bicolor]|uniref:AMP-dependent synthetase/ligase domain-containing protein n=1 Tax=Rhamnusium bicolor TaxID=1586634 RepID=A0AAV8XNP4_9CUCU|nr:hypothetical protein NQ314_010791 [Rhamnusium bicolor]
MSVLRQRVAPLVQNPQNGILSLLPINLGNNKRQYTINSSHKLRRTERLTNTLRHLSGGIFKSPLGDCSKIPKVNLVEYIFKDVEDFLEDPALVYEIRRQFENAGVKVIITVPLLLEVATTIGPTLQGYRSTICIGGEDDISKNVHGLESLLTAGHESELPGINPQELALLPYSSGTTGLPKGVMLSHYNLVANLVQGDHPALTSPYDNDGQRFKVLTVLPFFHIYGFNGILSICIRNGSHIITIPRFTPEDYIKALVTYRPTSLFVVPSLLLFLASHPAVTADHLASVQAVQSGAAPLSEGLLQKFREKINRPEVLIRQGYGMTESAPVTFFMPNLTPPSKLGSVGIPYPGTEAKIISLSTGEPLGTHQSGELLVRGPQLMMGYLNNERATAETIDEDGWLHTGDVAYYDEDGYLYIVDRCKELIKVKGNQTSFISSDPSYEAHPICG